MLALGPLPPEKCAYALARYSRSPDSILESLDWVRNHDSGKFLESYYFQYGHASIADLGHLGLCFEGVSELAAAEILDEPVWDGQARSTRYQDFSHGGFLSPPECAGEQQAVYREAGEALLEAYAQVHAAMVEFLKERLPRPPEMKPDAYRRSIVARAFDAARYLLFLGVSTNLGQVTSIRTLEKQIRRLKASPFAEVRDIAEEMAAACASEPVRGWSGEPAEPIAPTLARFVQADAHLSASRADLRLWARQNLPHIESRPVEAVELCKPTDTEADIVATLLYPETDAPYRDLYELASGWPPALRREVIETTLRSRAPRDELLRAFRGGPYVFDLAIDIGAYRDLHRHRRCHQFRQDYTTRLGFETPPQLAEAGLAPLYEQTIRQAAEVRERLPEPAAQYLTPFGSRSRFLFKMDFAEAEYLIRLRTGVKGHFSYRQVAWRMKQRLEEADPALGRLIQATPPWEEDPLTR